MQILFDLLPIVLFFIAFKFGGIYVATGVAIATTFLQIAYSWFKHKRVDTMLWVSLGIVVVFGGATLIFHDENFIKWKPTVLYGVLGSSLILSDLIFKKNLIRLMMEKNISLPATLWPKLSWAWGLFFFVMAALNLYIAFHFPTETWVNFKLFGTMGLMIAFLIAQGLVLAKYVEEKSSYDA